MKRSKFLRTWMFLLSSMLTAPKKRKSLGRKFLFPVLNASAVQTSRPFSSLHISFGVDEFLTK